MYFATSVEMNLFMNLWTFLIKYKFILALFIFSSEAAIQNGSQDLTEFSNKIQDTTASFPKKTVELNSTFSRPSIVILSQLDPLNISIPFSDGQLPTPPPFPQKLFDDNALLLEFLDYGNDNSIVETPGKTNKPPEDPFNALDYGDYSAVIPVLVSNATLPWRNQIARKAEIPVADSPPNLIPLTVQILSVEEKLYSSEKEFRSDNKVSTPTKKSKSDTSQVTSSEASEKVLQDVFGTDNSFEINELRKTHSNSRDFRSPFKPVKRRTATKVHPRFCCYLARNNHCLKRKEWMLLNCAQSCFDASCVECRDNDKYCVFWASMGECDTNPSYMLITCRRSCKLCNTLTTNL